MTVNENLFSNSAVGVAFLDPEKSGAVHLTVNPETGAIIMAEAHGIRLRGNGVDASLLNELGSTATALIMEYISNYLKSSAEKDDNISVTDPAFRNLLGQTVSGLDQMLVDTVTHGQNELVAYKMDKTKQPTPPDKNSLLGKISNSLEAVVYYQDGIHISHRGESQQYLVGARVQKLTQDHIAGGLFSKIAALEDFIPKIQTNSVPMKKNEQLVFFSREAALSSFPLNQLKQWIGEGDPREQAQGIAEALRGLGKTHGCVVVFSPGWEGTRQNDDIMSNGMFSLVNLANLDNEESGRISMIPENNHEEQAQEPLTGSAMDSVEQRRPSSARLHPKKRNSSLRLKSRTSMAADNAASIAPVDPFEPRRSHRRSIIESEMQSIVQKVMDQLPEQLDELETRIKADIQKRLSGARRDVLAQATGEVSKTMDKWVSEELPGIEERIRSALQAEIADMEMRIGKLMGKGLSGLRAEINTLKMEAEKWKTAMNNSNPAATAVNDTDEVELDELQQLDSDELDAMFSTIPGAIAGSATKPDTRLRQIKIVTPAVKEMKPVAKTLPAPAAPEPTINRDEEPTLNTTHENIGALAAQLKESPPDDGSIPSDEHTNELLQQIDVVLQQDSGAEDEIPEETNISYYPVSSSRNRKVVAIIIIGAAVLIAGAVVFLLSPFSPVSKDSLPLLGRLSASGESAETQPKLKKSENPPSPILSTTVPSRSPEPAVSQTSAERDDEKVSAPASQAETATSAATPSATTESTAPVESERNSASSQPETVSLYRVPPIPEMNIEQLYDNGLELYRKGDSGQDGETKLTQTQQYDVLKSALAHFEEIIRREGRIPPNVWYIKGRTEYNLTKVELSAEQRRQYASAALASYDRFVDTADKVSEAKAKTIARNQKKLKQIARN